MEVSTFPTAFPAPHVSRGEQDVLLPPPPAPAASTDEAKTEKRSRPRRSRRIRKQQAGNSSAAAAWSAWRREHEGQLEMVFQEHPEAYELYRQAMKSVPETLEMWQQSRVAWRPWLDWRKRHDGPLHEVLADPEGWALFCQMNAQRNMPLNVSYEEWLVLPEQQLQIRNAQWEAWRREHPGPQVLALMVAADSPGGVDEGWEIYRSLRKLKGESVPETFEEWRSLPKVCCEAALSAWALWRQNHAGRLQDVLADPEGWKLYREMFLYIPAGSRNRGGSRNLHESKLPTTYEEWLQRPKQQVALATQVWKAWREEHPGKLHAVLAAPEGWTLFRDFITKGLSRSTKATGDSENSGDPRRTGGDRKRRNRRKGTPSTFATAAATPMTTATATTTTTTAATAVDDGNDDDAEVEGGGSSTADEEQQQQQQQQVVVGSSTAGEEGNEDVSSFPETYEDWLAWRHRKSKQGATEPAVEAWTSHKHNQELWQRWRAEHPGPLEEVLAVDPEGWRLYSTWMSRNGGKAFFPDVQCWMEAQVATRVWLRWRKQHRGALAVALRNDSSGWPYYRAYVAGPLAFSSAAHANAQQQRQLPETLEEWLQQPAQIVQIAADAWNIWRQEHPGPLRAQLCAQMLEGQEEMSGWHRLRTLLQFFMSTAAGNGESGDRRTTDSVNKSVVGVLPESLQEFLPDFERTSRAAWLRWTQQQQRHVTLRTRLRDPVGWALYKVMCESQEGATEFASTYEEWLQKRTEQATVATNNSMESCTGTADTSAAVAATATQTGAAKPAIDTSKKQQNAGAVAAPVPAWTRWRRQHRGDLVQVLQKHPRGWQLYCNMLAFRKKPVPESLAAFKEQREQQKQQKQTEAVAEWEAWRQQHAGPLEDVLSDPKGAALYRKVIQATATTTATTTTSNSNTAGTDEKTLGNQEITSRWLAWREQHPGPLEVVLAEHPEASELHCAWLAVETAGATRTSKSRRRKPRGNKGGKIGTPAAKEAVRRWREWRAQHPGALQQVLAADLAAQGKQPEANSTSGEVQALQMNSCSPNEEQHLQQTAGAVVPTTGWDLFCAHAASQGRQMPGSFQEWLQQPQQIAQREFGIWRAEHPGMLVDVLREEEGWRLYVRMKRAASAAAAEEGLKLPEVVEDYETWVARRKLQRDPDSRRRNRRAKAEDVATNTDVFAAGGGGQEVTEQRYQGDGRNFEKGDQGMSASKNPADPAAPTAPAAAAAGCHVLENNASLLGPHRGGGSTNAAEASSVDNNSLGQGMSSA